MGPGDYVATTPYTFCSTAAVARYLGAEVAFCDISAADYNMDPAKLEAVLAGNKKDKGRPSHPRRRQSLQNGRDPRYLQAIRRPRSGRQRPRLPVRLVEGFAGTLGDIGVYSFYANKTVTTGEGGMIVSRDPALMRRMALMRSHGFDRDAWDRYTSTKPAWFL